MHLVMFDMDGTLTQTNEVDAACYAQAITDVLGIDTVDTDWSTYTNVTDQGCLNEVVLRHTGRAITPDESAAVKKRFFALLEEQVRAHPQGFAAVPGAIDVLDDLAARADTAVAIATGAWLESAHLKFRAAGIDYERFPIATCDDAIARTPIMALAEKRALKATGVDRFTSRTYVGDGVWDLRAANELSYDFIGLAQDGRAQSLLNAGAKHVLPDFTQDAFLQILSGLWNGTRR